MIGRSSGIGTRLSIFVCVLVALILHCSCVAQNAMTVKCELQNLLADDAKLRFKKYDTVIGEGSRVAFLRLNEDETFGSGSLAKKLVRQGKTCIYTTRQHCTRDALM